MKKSMLYKGHTPEDSIPSISSADSLLSCPLSDWHSELPCSNNDALWRHTIYSLSISTFSELLLACSWLGVMMPCLTALLPSGWILTYIFQDVKQRIQLMDIGHNKSNLPYEIKMFTFFQSCHAINSVSGIFQELNDMFKLPLSVSQICFLSIRLQQGQFLLTHSTAAYILYSCTAPKSKRRKRAKTEEV